ncbi:MAG: heavy-metal-associated domain-containing protein [Novosphingobium sp.]
MTFASTFNRLPDLRFSRATMLGFAAGAALLVAVGVVAQIEGDRGIAPVAISHDIQVPGIEVETTGKTPQVAREAGWVDAKKKAWAKLAGPAMSDSQLDGLVASIVIEHEQIGPHRYIARLNVVFDRSRAGQFIGGGDGAQASHSAPMLTIPVLWSGGVAQVYEVRGLWQAAWARFNPASSGIDYVRPSGSGGDSLLITAGQVTRRSRIWWGTALDQFQASDVVIPEARLDRQWPGGPVHGTFVARYGPDNVMLGKFELDSKNEAGVPAMLDQAVLRIDALYNQALAQGLLHPDPTLRATQQIDPQLAAIIAAAAKKEADTNPAADASAVPGIEPLPGTAPVPSPSPTAETKISAITVQFASPDAKAVDSAMASVRSVPGVRGASTTSLAMGGTSVMRVSFAGSLDDLRDALRSRGWTVSVGSGALSIRR